MALYTIKQILSRGEKMAKKLLATATVDVLYDEPDTSTYRGVQCRAGFYSETFNSGDISEDYREACKKGKEFATVVMNSSSVDDFLMDGPFIYQDGTIRRLKNEPRGSAEST